jgi:N-methylhydantoinase A
MPFGGAGPLHAEGCARALDIAQIIVPFSPGILCAQGLLVADLAESFVRSQRLTLGAESMAQLSGLVDAMLDDASAWWEAEGVGEAARSLKLAVDMRHSSQNYELQVPIETDTLAPALPEADELRRLFFAAHDQAYGFHNPADPVDVVAVRLTAFGTLPRPGMPTAPESATSVPVPHSRRPVWFDDDEPVDTPVYDRSGFAPGMTLAGPAVIDQFDATVLVFPGDVASVDEALNIVIDRARASA